MLPVVFIMDVRVGERKKGACERMFCDMAWKNAGFVSDHGQCILWHFILIKKGAAFAGLFLLE